jgi:hypothetical protein
LFLWILIQEEEEIAGVINYLSIVSDWRLLGAIVTSGPNTHMM